MAGVISLQEAAHGALMASDPDDKINRAIFVRKAFRCGRLELAHPELVISLPCPGRPSKPELVAPNALEKRGAGTARGRACLIHAIAHIEFNAINLALDAVYRFPGLPRRYYADWLRVADDEGRHFRMLTDRLQQLGYAYGDFNAHNGLWEMAVETESSCLERMALVPRVLEARGLDVTPAMIRRFDDAGDPATAQVLRIILREEVEHVAIGTRWFHHHCAQQQRDPEATFLALVKDRFGSIKLPMNEAARSKAGFGAGELAALRRLA